MFVSAGANISAYCEAITDTMEKVVGHVLPTCAKRAEESGELPAGCDRRGAVRLGTQEFHRNVERLVRRVGAREVPLARARAGPCGRYSSSATASRTRARISSETERLPLSA